MSSADLKAMVDKLAGLANTSYLSDEESAEVTRLLAIGALTQANVDWLTDLYNRLYSLRVGNQ